MSTHIHSYSLAKERKSDAGLGGQSVRDTPSPLDRSESSPIGRSTPAMLPDEDVQELVAHLRQELAMCETARVRISMGRGFLDRFRKHFVLFWQF
jgi:hypothetical protein